jgi:urease accessory protein
LSEPLIYLTERTSAQANENCLILPLSAKERAQLRGKRSTLNGIEVILNLPRGGGRLIPGEVLKSDDSLFYVTIEAAKEDLIKVSSDNRLKLLKAAYHLGNRHVEIEFHERDIYLLNDVVMRKMLEQQGLEIEFAQGAFSPEIGAYK